MQCLLLATVCLRVILGLDLASVGNASACLVFVGSRVAVVELTMMIGGGGLLILMLVSMTATPLQLLVARVRVIRLLTTVRCGWLLVMILLTRVLAIRLYSLLEYITSWLFLMMLS